MNQRLFSIAALTLSTLALPQPARAGGYLWLGSEYQGAGTIYRYDIADGVVDLSVSPALPGGATHWNNMATDGTTLYLGNPTTQYLGFADPYTGVVGSSTTYSVALAGHKEDGAFRPGSGTLWRVTYSGYLHEMTTAGVWVRSFTGLPPLVGLEWVGETLYATDYSAANPAHVGVITLDEMANTATFTVVPWASGGAPPGGAPGDWAGALAYDAMDGDLYLATYSSTRLFIVTFAGGEATATLVATLQDVGYVAGGLIDGMGWVAPEATGVHGGASPQFEVRVAPNPFEAAAFFSFELDGDEAVTVTLFDVTGARVRTIRAGSFLSGAHAVRWDGRDDAGNSAHPGVYFYRVTAGARVASGKVVLLR
jgi:hypothetical protein